VHRKKTRHAIGFVEQQHSDRQRHGQALGQWQCVAGGADHEGAARRAVFDRGDRFNIGKCV
jgi:hypothetical protein